MKMNADDHALAIVKAGISAVPVIGRSLASLLGDYVPDRTNQSVQKALTYLRNRLEYLEGRIDIDSVNKDEFSELFKSCYLTIIRTHK